MVQQAVFIHWLGRRQTLDPRPLHSSWHGDLFNCKTLVTAPISRCHLLPLFLSLEPAPVADRHVADPPQWRRVCKRPLRTFSRPHEGAPDLARGPTLSGRTVPVQLPHLQPTSLERSLDAREPLSLPRRCGPGSVCGAQERPLVALPRPARGSRVRQDGPAQIIRNIYRGPVLLLLLLLFDDGDDGDDDGDEDDDGDDDGDDYYCFIGIVVIIITLLKYIYWNKDIM